MHFWEKIDQIILLSQKLDLPCNTEHLAGLSDEAINNLLNKLHQRARPSTTQMSEELPVDRLKKIMGQTTNDNDHVALMAVRMANKFLADNGWTWDRLLDGKIRVAANPFANLKAPPTTSSQGRAPAPPPPPPRQFYDLEGYAWDTQAKCDYANVAIRARRRAAAAAAKPKVFPVIGSQYANKHANHCHCCGVWVDQHFGFIFKPADHGATGFRGKWAVACKPCNNNPNLVVVNTPAKKIGGPANLADLI